MFLLSVASIRIKKSVAGCNDGPWSSSRCLLNDNTNSCIGSKRTTTADHKQSAAKPCTAVLTYPKTCQNSLFYRYIYLDRFLYNTSYQRCGKCVCFREELSTVQSEPFRTLSLWVGRIQRQCLFITLYIYYSYQHEFRQFLTTTSICSI